MTEQNIAEPSTRNISNGQFQLRVVQAEDLDVAFELLKQLRTTLEKETFYKILSEAKESNKYVLTGLYQNDHLFGLMGYRILTDFVHGRHLYIDDLVVDASQRSNGLGALLLKQAEEIAAELGCDGLRLCTGIENESACKFYLREGWKQRAFAFKKKVAAEK